MKITAKHVLSILGILLLAGAGLMAFLPIPQDEVLPEEKWGAGSSSVEPAYSGLQRAFPASNEPAENPTTPAKIELGRLLFFDPVLSKNNDLSCATCHNPDLGFSDGLQVAQGNGESLTRNTMSLWNVVYSTKFFWDGRAETLEAQMLVPLTAENEMAGDPETIVEELKSIPAYVEMFERAFGAKDAITFENVQYAIAAFQRSLVTNNSPFDRYAAGQFNALTAQQRRGLDLFRSANTRCFECHAAPTFGLDAFFVTGSPDLPGQPHDLGRAGVAADGEDGAFKSPTLRNIVLSAPYMHNGAFATLEEVLDFYAQGGGRPDGVTNVHRHVTGFEMNDQDKEDMIAFLYALTDESSLPEFPESVPSGLPVVERAANPTREIARVVNVPATEAGEVPASQPKTVRVGRNESIQEAVDRAGPGDTIEVPYGIYKEDVVIDYNDITLLGIPNEAGEWPIIEGEGFRSDGVIASGNNFEMAFFQVKNFTSNGVLVEGVTNVYLHDLYIENTGVYGVYPVRCTDVLMERIEGTLVNDAAIYAGKSENVIIRDSVVYGNVIGIEVENTVNSEIYNNHAYDNTVGIFVDLLPQLPSKVSLYTKVHNNITENNNGENFGTPGTAVALIPPGTGMLILGADHVEVYDNVIRGNKSVGLAVFNLTIGFSKDEIDVGPNPEHIYAHGNTYENNGFDADKFVRDLLGGGFDIVWDGSGMNNRFDEQVSSSFPPVLPASSWPDPLYNFYWRVLNFVISMVG